MTRLSSHSRGYITRWFHALESILIEKLIITCLVKKFPVIFAISRFLTIFQELTIHPYPEPDEPITHPFSLFFLKIHFNITLISMHRTSEGFLSFILWDPDSGCFSHCTCVFYMPHWFQLPSVGHPGNIWLRVKIMKLHIQLSPASYLLLHILFCAFSLWFSLNVKDQVSQAVKKAHNIIVYIKPGHKRILQL